MSNQLFLPAAVKRNGTACNVLMACLEDHGGLVFTPNAFAVAPLIQRDGEDRKAIVTALKTAILRIGQVELLR